MLSNNHASVLGQGLSHNPSHLLALKEEKGKAAIASRRCRGNLGPASSVTAALALGWGALSVVIYSLSLRFFR